MQKFFISRSAQDTEDLATAAASFMKGGEAIFLRGDIGTGKTVFVRALATALGLKDAPVSASFSIMKEYHGPRFGLLHLDLFRLSEDEVLNVGVEEFLADPALILAVEWPAPIERFITPALDISFKLLEGDGREISVQSASERGRELLGSLCKTINK